MNDMKNQIDKNLLKHHVMTAITCPQCTKILDMRRAVSVDLMKDGDLKRTWILCSDCWDKKKLALRDVATQSGHSLEALDGRELFGPKVRRGK